MLAQAILKEAKDYKESLRDIKQGINKAYEQTVKHLDQVAIPVEGEMIDQVAAISSNNDKELGDIIGEAFKKVGKNGTVFMDPDGAEETSVEVVSGSQIIKALQTPTLLLM